jgi:hypothetical protein
MNQQKKLRSKVFNNFSMAIGQDRDSDHQKVWNGKTEEPKHVQ